MASFPSPKPGDMIGRFKRIRHLGSGTFGTAWLVSSSKSGNPYVIKEMVIANEKGKTKNEVDILKRCFHFNIIRQLISEFFYGGNEDEVILYMVMEYADGGDLHQYINKWREENKTYMSESKILNWFIQIALALNYLHREMILHRDLKTHNIFVTAGNKILKLGDFGISRTLSHENEFATTGIGTPQYLSPEMCQSQPYNYKSDIWSLGCVLYEMCVLEPAFSGNELAPLVQKIVKGEYKTLPSHFSDHIKDLVKVLLRPIPEKRPSASQILSSPIFIDEVKSYMNHVATFPSFKKCIISERKDSCGSISSTELPSQSN
ncbi:serine/threonine-protein kinase Nek5 isoform X2 [Lepeophtheirus salmonis]|uniref:serine/threonine-protein kinase Nek5 isoform X2 n=1 Tax=Lepeophtheirus salmonis TaxID=72036 RepID=UPI001AEA3A15|nr:serine/threonine-protein kinase Nek5-like isoform X2 [Lepeophtheirus salmonis]